MHEWWKDGYLHNSSRLSLLWEQVEIILKIHTAIPFTDTPAVQVPPSGAEADKEAAAAKTAPKKGLKLTYDEYKQMANLLVCHMRKMEETADGENFVDGHAVMTVL